MKSSSTININPYLRWYKRTNSGRNMLVWTHILFGIHKIPDQSRASSLKSEKKLLYEFEKIIDFLIFFFMEHF